MGKRPMDGLPNYLACPVEFCADDVGRAWHRRIECNAQHRELGMCRHQLGILVERRAARVEPGRQRATFLLRWAGEPGDEIAGEVGDARPLGRSR